MPRFRVLGTVAVCLVAALAIQSCLYERYKGVCEDIESGAPLADAADALESAGGKPVGVVGTEHHFRRLRFSMKHQLCIVEVDQGQRVVSTTYRDSWDLL